MVADIRATEEVAGEEVEEEVVVGVEEEVEGVEEAEEGVGLGIDGPYIKVTRKTNDSKTDESREDRDCSISHLLTPPLVSKVRRLLFFCHCWTKYHMYYCIRVTFWSLSSLIATSHSCHQP